MADETGASGSSGSAVASSATPSTASTSTPSAAPASATSTPHGNGSAATTTAAGSGSPPEDRWPSILDNARTKTRSEVEAEYRQKYGWADSFQNNPAGFIEQAFAELANHPEHGQRLLQMAARTLNARRGQQQAAQEPVPDVPIVDANGNVTGQTYSAAQLKKWRDWDWAQKQAALDKRLGPLEKDRGDREAAQHMASLQQKSTEHARTTLDGLRQNPYFKEHEAKVKAALAANEAWGDNIHAAFNHVLVTDILPNLSQSEQKKVVDSLNAKAGAGTVHPSGQANGTPTTREDFRKMGTKATLEYFAANPEIAKQWSK